MNSIDRLVVDLAAVLKARGWMMATAESCTGGLIAGACTDLAGSSDWFERGFITYSNRAKQELLNVKADSLRTHGAVSEAVAQEMAAGACHHAPVQASVAVTGVAGPGGGSDSKPVGTVCFAWSVGGQMSSQTMHFGGDRSAVRHATVRHALQGLLERCRADAAP